jgi:hypothetical protein
MFSYAGSVHPFIVSEWLVLALVGPLLTLAYAARCALTGETKHLRFAAMAGFATSAATIAWQWIQNRDKTVLQHVLGLVRLGQLDLGLDLALDTIGAVMALSVLAASVATVGVQEKQTPRSVMSISACALGGVLASLADNVPLTAVGAALGAASAMIASRRVTVIGRASELCLLFGAAALFWSFGGRFGAERFVVDLSPRLVAAAAARPAPDQQDDDDEIRVDPRGNVTPKKRSRPTDLGGSFLAVDALSGSIVYVDESQTPIGGKNAPQRTPIAKSPLAAGMHTLRVHAGAGLDDYLVSQVFFATNSVVTIAPLGPTLVYRHANQQIDLEAPKGLAQHRDERLLAMGLAFLALAAFLRVRDVARLTESSAVPAAAMAVPMAGALAFIRLAPLVQSFPRAQYAFAIAGALAFIVFGARAARANDMRAICTHLSEALSGVAISGAAIGTGASAVGALALGATAPVALLLSSRSGSIGTACDVRHRAASLVACLATSSAIPIVGSIWVLAGAFVPALAKGSAPMAIVLLALGGIGALLASLAAFRLHLFAFDEEKEEKKTAVEPFTLALALFALLVPTVVAASPRAAGANLDGPISSLVLPAAPIIGVPGFAGALVLAGALLAGRAAAQRRFSSKRASRRSHNAALRARLRLLALGGSMGLGARARAGAVAFARAIDEHVVGFAWRAIGALVWAAGWFSIHVEQQPLANAGDRLARVSSVVSPRLVAIGFAIFVLALAALELVAR